MNIEWLSEIKKQFVAREVGEELVIVPLSANVAQMNELFTLNETAKFLWEKLGADCSVASLSADLVGAYEIDMATATRDVEAFLERMDVLKKYTK
jgi:hypothetical protein